MNANDEGGPPSPTCWTASGLGTSGTPVDGGSQRHWSTVVLFVSLLADKQLHMTGKWLGKKNYNGKYVMIIVFIFARHYFVPKAISV